MFERFTKDVRRLVMASIQIAVESGEGKAGPEHLLLALASGEGVGRQVLDESGISASVLREAFTNPTRRVHITEDEAEALRTLGIDAEEVLRRVEEAFGPDALDPPPSDPPRRRRGLLGGPFNASAKKALELSLREAVGLRHRTIGSEHVLLALLRTGLPDPMAAVLTEHGVTYHDTKQRILAESDTAA